MIATMTDPFKGTLLIVEDEQGLVDVLVVLARTIGLQTFTAMNGEEALKIINNHKEIDAVLSDIKMPVMDGLKLLSEVRKQNMDLPFVFLTAFNDKDTILSALKLGATDFIEKPFEHDKILQVLSRSVELGRILKAIEQELKDLDYESEKLKKKRQEMQQIRLSMLGSDFHYRKIQIAHIDKKVQAK